jgi:ribosomal protein S18 acetylase RimI-like enzyme
MGGYDGHRGWVNYLAVDPSVQYSGLGKQIMSELESRLMKIGCPKINVQIRSDNQHAVEFYKRIGYSFDAVICVGKRLVDD